MATKPSRAYKARPKKNKKSQGSGSQTRQPADRNLKTRHPARKSDNHNRPNANTNTHKITTRKASFLLLPPEIRWQIYQELFHLYRVEIIRRKDKKKGKKKRDPPKSTPYRLCHRHLVPRGVRSQTVWRNPGRPAYEPLPIAIVFACKLTYCETIHLFYSKMQFVFNCTKTIARFLKTASKDSQSAINHVELNHIMYNEPRLTEFREYKFRSDRAWYLVCDEMSQSFGSLRVLHVHMTVFDWPIHLEIGERWSFPLLVFGEHGRQLDIAHIWLQMPRFSKEKLKSVARSIEEKIMRPESFQIREDERLARKLMGRVKARKILTLAF
ncbi:hypothetical protein P170DRAFT_397515 [Aspergillus steynii IBT 23096]|uniref:DUF7730 domain-containing protein n=1 Tax=Aspergillus steynii IBT 23096 TaxID=1392250 RepID=A0A2I2GN11_9EURO|nr:uncharacterized protein P170DRAFT_397515 [Aspergillus steynii IBT 23096]PLB54272.1 hypothetical protein P170DRAFT_397515 [Aspergillus steynii IBT 23096]